MKKLIVIIAMILIPSLCFGVVTVVNTKSIDGTKQWVYIQLTVDEDVCRYVTVQPWNSNTPVLSGQALTDWANSREARYNVEILNGMYPGARYLINNGGQTILNAFEQWITDGHTNSAYCKGKTESTEQSCQDAEGRWVAEEVIVKASFKDSWSSVKVNAEKDMKQSIFYNKTNQQIQNYLVSNVTNLNEVLQYLYKLTIHQRNMERRQGWSTD